MGVDNDSAKQAALPKRADSANNDQSLPNRALSTLSQDTNSTEDILMSAISEKYNDEEQKSSSAVDSEEALGVARATEAAAEEKRTFFDKQATVPPPRSTSFVPPAVNWQYHEE